MKCANWVCAVVLAFGFGAVQAVEVAAAADKAARAAPPTRVTDKPTAMLDALKRNDFAAWLESIEDDKDIAEIAKRWDSQIEQQREYRAKRAAEPADPDAPAAHSTFEAETEQLWAKLQTREGVDALVDEYHPKLSEAVSKHLLSFNLGFGAMLTSIASDQNLSADEVQQLTQLMVAVQNWTGRVDFADRERLHRALSVVAQSVRQTKLKRFADAQDLKFEDAVVHGDQMIATLKKVFAVYDVDVDQILNSVRFSEVDVFGDSATLRAEARVFGVDLSHNFKMRYMDNEWIPAEYAEVREQLQPESAEAEAAMEAAAAAAAAAEAAAPAKPKAKAKSSSSGSCGTGAEFDVEIDAATARSAAKQAK